MAANYWVSTQYRHWLFSKPQLAEIRTSLENHERTLVQQYPLPERRLLSLFFRERPLIPYSARSRVVGVI